MPAPVKVSDRLLTLAREEAESTHRSATAQIEHWATLGRAVEALVAHQDLLALKRAGQALPLPASVAREDVHRLLARLAEGRDRERVKRKIHAAGAPVYAADPDRPDLLIEIRPDGTRVRGRMQGRRFVAVPGGEGRPSARPARGGDAGPVPEGARRAARVVRRRPPAGRQ
jgi:hypothetical protein